MSNYKCQLLLVLVILFSSVNGDYFKCFVCTSLHTPYCKDPFNVSQLTLTSDCNSETDVCLKQEVPSQYYAIDDEVRRGCVPWDYCIGEDKKSSHCSTCRSYLCNSSITISSIGYLLLHLIPFILYLLN